jgi:hypothetical protein
MNNTECKWCEKPWSDEDCWETDEACSEECRRRLYLQRKQDAYEAYCDRRLDEMKDERR